MKHRILTAAATASALAAATPALAIDYDYVEPRYTFAGDAIDVGDVTGFGLEVSRSFEEWFFLRANADFYGIDEGGDADATLDLFSIGPGVRLPLTVGQNQIELYGALNYQRVATGNVENGISADVGAAMDITDDLEGRVQMTSMDDDEVDLDLYEVRVAYQMSSDWALTGSLLNGDADVGDSQRDLDNLVRVGVRFGF